MLLPFEFCVAWAAAAAAESLAACLLAFAAACWPAFAACLLALAAAFTEADLASLAVSSAAWAEATSSAVTAEWWGWMATHPSRAATSMPSSAVGSTIVSKPTGASGETVEFQQVSFERGQQVEIHEQLIEGGDDLGEIVIGLAEPGRLVGQCGFECRFQSCGGGR